MTLAGAGAAQAAAPVIVNNGNGSSWIESQAGTQGTSNRRAAMTFVVRHDPNRRIVGVAFDKNYNGTDDTPTMGTTGVTAEFLGTTGNSSGTNRLASSVLRFNDDAGDPGGFDCPAFSGGTRRRDLPLRFRVVDDLGQRSGTVSVTYHWVEEDGCTNTAGTADYPVLETVSQSATTATPGQNVNFTFLCDDADSSGSNDRCDYIQWHWRRLSDGVTSASVNQDAEDNTSRTFGASFPTRGIYVVEAYLCGEDSCEDSTLFRWRLGTVVVNETANPTGSLDFSGAGVAPGSPDSVNQGDAANAVATVSDSGTGGIVQVIDWDADNNGSYERTDYTTPQLGGGGLFTPALGSTELTQAVDTSTAGLKTIGARIYDNGAADAADNTRRSTTFSSQIRVNARPTAANGGGSTVEDFPVNIALSAADADSQPAALTYEVVGAPAHGSVTISANTATYTPAANYSGTDSFTFRAKDGPSSAAWSYSNTATVNVSIAAVNDTPVADSQLVSTDEDTALGITLSASDVDGDTLTYGIHTLPSHGSVSCAGTACTYTPAANYHGSDQFKFHVDDGHGGVASGTIDITVRSVNDAPVADDLSTSTDEDTPITFGLPTSDDDGDALAIVTTAPSHGTVTCAATCTYTPAANYHGPDAFDYTADDGQGGTDGGHVDITVNSVNDDPVAGDQSLATDEDATLSVTLGATDIDGDSLSYAATQPAHGSVSCSGSDCTYTPAANFHGNDSFAFTVDDGNGGTDSGQIDVEVRPVNDDPVADDASASTDEDTAVTVTIGATDVDGDTLSADVDAGPSHGSATCAGLDCTYTPDPDYNGSDSFTVTVSDANGGTDTATVDVEVRPVNDAPVAADQSVSTDEDVHLNVTLGASDVDGDSLSYVIDHAPDHGGASCTGNTCTYTPAQDYNGPDSFTFTVSDGHGGSDSGQVDVDVTPVNDAPVATDTAATTLEDLGVTVAIPATDVDGDTLAATVDAAPGHGSATCSGLECTYTPAADFNGSDFFTVTVSDGHGGTDGARVDVEVTPVNDAPAAADVTVTTDEDVQSAIGLVATDIDGDALTYTVADAPQHGSVICPGTGETCAYAPASNYNGPDSFTFVASDGHGGTDTGSVSITVAAVNDAPVGGDLSLSIPEDASVSLSVPVSDVDGDALEVSVTGAAGHGAASCTTAGFCTYAPAANYHGPDAFTYTVADGNGGTDTGTISFEVTPVNDPPAAHDANLTTAEDTTGNAVVEATDVDGDDLDFTVSSAPLHGSASCDGDGHCSYAPAANFNGPDVFEVTASDGHGGTDIALVHVAVTPVNDAPVAQDGSASTDEDHAVNVVVSAGDVDGDGLSADVTGGPAHGSASCSGLTCTYTPAADYYGTDAFEVTVSDGNGGTDTATIAITVAPVNDAPVAADLTAATDEDTAVEVALVATDIDGDTLSYAAGAQPAHGSVTCADGSCTYWPAANYNGPDSFTFTVSDGHGGTDSGQVDVTVRPVNDAPDATDETIHTPEDTTRAFTLHAADLDGDGLTFAVVTSPSHGSLTCDGASCAYTPAANYNGPDSFTFKASDGHGGEDAGTISIVVDPVNDGPTAQNVTVSTDEDTAADFSLLGSDIDDTLLTYTLTSAPAHGTVSCANALCHYVPAADYHGTDTLLYKVTDPSGASASARVDIAVNSVLDATKLTAPPVIKISGLPLKLTIMFQATLTRASNGSPIAGRTITWIAGGQRACSAKTNAYGWAGCGWSVPSILGVLVGTGYTAVFDGDDDYSASTGSGQLVG